MAALTVLLTLAAVQTGTLTGFPDSPATDSARQAERSPRDGVLSAGPSYARDVAPLLDRYCRHCHSAVDPHGGLDLDGYAAVMRGGDSGPVVVPGDPSASLLIAKVERRDRPAMPPRRTLRKSAIATLRAWIAAGAPP